MCIELSMIVTELGLPHILRSDNGPCYNSNEFQQFLQHYSIMHQTSNPNYPRGNGFVECMVGVAKKLMDKAGKERKPWMSGLFEYRITPQAGSLASPLQMITQCKPREKNLPQLPSALGAQEMHQTHQELIRKQGNRADQELLPGTPVWVQHRQNTQWEPAVVINQTDAPNSYWIMCENGSEQPRVYKGTHTFMKIISTPTDGKQKAQMKEWMPETTNAEFQAPAVLNGNRNLMAENSHDTSSPGSPKLPLPTLDLPNSQNFSQRREKEGQLAESLCTSGSTLESAPNAPVQ